MTRSSRFSLSSKFSKFNFERPKFDFSKLNLRNWKFCPPTLNTRSTQNPKTEKSTIYVCPKAGDGMISMAYDVNSSHRDVLTDIQSRFHSCASRQWATLDKKRKIPLLPFTAPSTKRLVRSCKEQFQTIFDSEVDTRNTGRNQSFLQRGNNASRFQYKTISENHYETLSKIQETLNSGDMMGLIVTPTQKAKTLSKLIGKGEDPAYNVILKPGLSAKKRQTTLEHMSARLYLERHKILESENPTADCDDFLNYKIPPESNNFSDFERVAMNRDAQHTFSYIMEKIPSFRSSYLASYLDTLRATRSKLPESYLGLSIWGTHYDDDSASFVSLGTEGE